MAKKKTNKLNLVNIVAILLAIVAVALFIFLPMLKLTVGDEGNQIVTVYKGLGMIFGGTVNSEITTTVTLFGNTTTSTDTLAIEDIELNMMALVSLLLLVIGLVATGATTFVKSFTKNKIFTFIAGILLVVGGILMLTLKDSAIEVLGASLLSDSFSLGIGTILASICAIVSGAIVGIYPIVKK